MKRLNEYSFANSLTHPGQPVKARLAFTLIELLVVIGAIAMLTLLLIPTLAGARADNTRAQCQNNLAQLGIGCRLFEQDHNDMFPPGAFQGVGPLYQISWDSYIHRYIGGTSSEADLTFGAMYPAETPAVLICPAAPNRVVSWALFNGESLFARRTYAMVGTYQYLQVSPSASPPVYRLTQPTQLGVGIYWFDTSRPADWDAQSLKTSVVKDPGGTILLVEQSENGNLAGNVWPAVSLGVDRVAWGGYMLCQMNSAQAMVTNGAVNANLGKFLYQNHGFRYNYLFHDGHVELLSTNATIGAGTPAAPLGMWTVNPAD